ncbi:MAG: MazG nucleotide pyrophosphohydrolase domain-containing protein [Planctomycetaceae bacterium]
MAEKVFRELIDIIARLRGGQGCPWDREQKMEDLARYIREEAEEVAQAIASKSRADVAEELGDLLFNIVFAARIAEEEGAFDLGLVLTGIRDKIVRRHPHVFGSETAATPEEVLVHWNRVKEEERRERESRGT